MLKETDIYTYRSTGKYIARTTLTKEYGVQLTLNSFIKLLEELNNTYSHYIINAIELTPTYYSIILEKEANEEEFEVYIKNRNELDRRIEQYRNKV